MTAEKKSAARRQTAAKRGSKTAHGRRVKKPARKPAASKTPRAPSPEEVKAAVLELREIRKAADKFKKELRLSDDSAADPFLRERLFTDLALNFFYDGEQDSDAFLKEAREQKKVAGKTAAPSDSRKSSARVKRNPGKDLEQIYGPGVVVVESAEHD